MTINKEFEKLKLREEKDREYFFLNLGFFLACGLTAIGFLLTIADSYSNIKNKLVIYFGIVEIIFLLLGIKFFFNTINSSKELDNYLDDKRKIKKKDKINSLKNNNLKKPFKHFIKNLIPFILLCFLIMFFFGYYLVPPVELPPEENYFLFDVGITNDSYLPKIQYFLLDYDFTLNKGSISFRIFTGSDLSKVKNMQIYFPSKIELINVSINCDERDYSPEQISFTSKLKDDFRWGKNISNLVISNFSSFPSYNHKFIINFTSNLVPAGKLEIEHFNSDEYIHYNSEGKALIFNLGRDYRCKWPFAENIENTKLENSFTNEKSIVLSFNQENNNKIKSFNFINCYNENNQKIKETRRDIWIASLVTTFFLFFQQFIFKKRA